MSKKITAFLTLCMLTGCAGVFKSAPDFNRISIGMEKQQVFSKIGKPTHASADGDQELLAYEWDNMWDGKGAGMWSYVTLRNGRVTGYNTDYLRQSTNFNVAEAQMRVHSAPRTNVNQSATVIQQTQTNYLR
jgi:hypothetical protein